MKLTKEEKRKIRKRIKIFHPLFFKTKKIELSEISAVQVSLRPFVSRSVALLCAPFVLVFMIFSTIIDFIKTLSTEIKSFDDISRIQRTIILKNKPVLSDEEMVELKEKLG